MNVLVISGFRKGSNALKILISESELLEQLAFFSFLHRIYYSMQLLETLLE